MDGVLLVNGRPPIGSDFDSWLEEEDLLERTEAVAAKRVLEYQTAALNADADADQGGGDASDEDEPVGTR